MTRFQDANFSSNYLSFCVNSFHCSSRKKWQSESKRPHKVPIKINQGIVSVTVEMNK